MILLIQCPDQPGIIANITSLIANSGGNIINLDQHTAVDFNLFLMRIDFEVQASFLPSELLKQLQKFDSTANFIYHLIDNHHPQKAALLVSKTSHCLYELLLQQQQGLLHCSFPVIISNHLDLKNVAEYFKIPFYHIDVQLGKAQAEASIQQIIRQFDCEIIIMARYMQILSAEFTQSWTNRIINIHHGFLPAFKGAKPYHQAWNKGVKLIGATAHFATPDLDQGPIISQDVVSVNDCDSIADFIRMGQDIERRVLSQAVRSVCEHRVFIHNNRTFVLGV